MTGQRVISLTTKHRRFAKDFPGWSHPNFHDYLLETTAGLQGMVTYVEQHGSNPWTRYSIEFDDGSSMCGACEGTDFTWG